LPEYVDAEYLRDAGIPEGTIGRTLFALRFLGIIEEGGIPTSALRSIHTSTDEEYRTVLAGLVREAYKEVFNVVDPAEDTQDRIINVFRRYTPASQRSRMAGFFLGMCREAAIPTLDVPRQRAMVGTRQVANKPSARPSSTEKTGPAPGVTHPKAGYPSGVPPALDGLVRSLPAEGTPLSITRRQQWLKMAEATLAFVYPEEAETVTEEQEQEETDE
jgi:hypothetical protein